MSQKQNGKVFPGPFDYSPLKVKGKSPAFTLKERPKTSYFDPGKEILAKPPPNKYNVRDDIARAARFRNISFGRGHKMLGYYSITRRKQTPGPGDYRNMQELNMTSATGFTQLGQLTRRSQS
jgi:hypothetical protein